MTAANMRAAAVRPRAPGGTGNRHPHRRQDAVLRHGFKMPLDSGLCINIGLALCYSFKDAFLYVLGRAKPNSQYSTVWNYNNNNCVREDLNKRKAVRET